jgi:hypothetical protein
LVVQQHVGKWTTVPRECGCSCYLQKPTHAVTTATARLEVLQHGDVTKVLKHIIFLLGMTMMACNESLRSTTLVCCQPQASSAAFYSTVNCETFCYACLESRSSLDSNYCPAYKHALP